VIGWHGVVSDGLVRCANNLVGTMMSMMDGTMWDVDCWHDDVWNVDWEGDCLVSTV